MKTAEVKKIIINADDFGLSPGINRAVVECYEKGTVTSASIIPTARYFFDAVKLSKINAGLDIGIHLTLVEEVPLSLMYEIPSLMNKKGRFYKDYRQFFLRYILGEISKRQIEKEFRSQIERCLEAGLKLTHVNSHQYIHCFPAIFDIAGKLCEEYRLPFISYPYSRIKFQDFGNPKVFPQLILNGLFRVWGYENVKVSKIQNFAGFIQSGRLNEKFFERLLKTARNGVTEIVCHPGILDEYLENNYSHWNYRWQREYRFFSSEKVKMLLKKYNIQLISFKDLRG